LIYLNGNNKNNIRKEKNMNTIQIIKYGNRKFYNKNNSHYMNLSEIKDVIEKGYIVKIIDYKTKQDITKEVLLKLLFLNKLQKVELINEQELLNELKQA
jgi:polyhydroxyalkanoate synthesis regulator protein